MFTRTILSAALLASLTFRAEAREPDTLFVGIHQAESEYYSGVLGNMNYSVELSPETPVLLKSRSAGNLTHKVYGWHPYWADPGAYLSYDYTALSHIAYFGLEVDTATGGYTTLRGWDTTPIISYAHQRGVKVTLTVINFGSARNTELLTDTVKQWNLINTVISQLQSRNGDGVNFDFESVPAAQKANMVSFCHRAVKGIKAVLPAAEISLATPAVNWSDGWDLGALAGICDYLIMMGYNYYWSGSATAGPVAPVSGENYHIVKSINEDYMADGVPPGKLLLGVPWYGYDWPVTGSERKSATTGTGTSRTYNSALALVAAGTRIFDDATGVPYICYQTTQWRQMWYDDSTSLQIKSNIAKDMYLAGIGIWALSYEAGRPELWKGLKTAFLENYTSSDGEISSDRAGELEITPNPVTERSVIRYSITKRTHVTLRIYDTGGRLIVSLTGRVTEPGSYTEPLRSGALTPGFYICVMQTRYGRSAVKFAVTETK
ncbi:MAG: glycosyl hydrolase family 18 protein [Bacteroidales bacterium]